MQPEVSSDWSLAGPLADRAGRDTMKNGRRSFRFEPQSKEVGRGSI
jgi:hypothetical protein